LALADCFRKGVGLSQDSKEAVRWYRKAAMKDTTGEAHFILSHFSSVGLGTPQDNRTARMHLIEGVRLGNARCLYNLGLEYLAGTLVPHNHTRGIVLIEAAGRKNLSEASFTLGNLYLNELGLFLEDTEDAFQEFKKAAMQGHGEASNSLALMYFHGIGCNQSVRLSTRWWEKGAREGVCSAMFNLARANFHNFSVNASNATAIHMCKEAAEKGSRAKAPDSSNLDPEFTFSSLSPDSKPKAGWQTLSVSCHCGTLWEWGLGFHKATPRQYIG